MEVYIVHLLRELDGSGSESVDSVFSTKQNAQAQVGRLALQADSSAIRVEIVELTVDDYPL